METKLKSLKVVDLKQVLSKANVAPAGKANKAELIAKILASPAAVDAFNTLYPSDPPPAANDDLLAPPEDLDWTVDEVPHTKLDESVPEPETKIAAISSDGPATVTSELELASVLNEPSKTPATTASAPNVIDVELEKRKQRAARFGIALVEPKSQTKQTSSVAKKTNDPTIQSNEHVDKIKARAERFGLKIAANGKAVSNQTSPVSKRKRGTVPATEVDVDPEEAERRRKRAERFGLKV